MLLKSLEETSPYHCRRLNTPATDTYAQGHTGQYIDCELKTAQNT